MFRCTTDEGAMLYKSYVAASEKANENEKKLVAE